MADASPFRYASADDSAGFLLFKLTTLWQRRLAQLFDGFGITQTQYAILASLRWFEAQHDAQDAAQHGEKRNARRDGKTHITTQSQLADHAHLEAMTLSKAIRALEGDGLVTREPSSTDSRAMVVRLTAQGRKLTQKAVAAIEQADEGFFGGLSERQASQYKSLVLSLIAANSG